MTAFLDQTSDAEAWDTSTKRRLRSATTAGGDKTRSRQPNHSAQAVSGTERNHRASLLHRVVEAEILPRLALARSAQANKPVDTSPPTTTDDADRLVKLLLGSEADAAASFLDVFRGRGATTASLYLGIVTNAARLLGELWEDDRCDFTQVTISMGRLQQIVRSLSPAFQIAAVSHAHPETALLVPAPGDQHTLGLVILSEFFQREGWHVPGGPAPPSKDAADMARETWVDIAGFSIGSASRLDGLCSMIRTLRRVSRNRDISVMVGGPLLLRQPDLVSRVGADIGAVDAQSAVRQASGLLALRTAAD